jgi:hypothetical protein
MRRVVPAKRRSTSSAVPGGIRVVIPARRRWFLSAFMSLWLVFIASAAVPATRDILRSYQRYPTVFVTLWVAAWVLVVASVVAALAWYLAGKEVVLAAGSTLAVRREALGVGRTREYDLAHVRNLRVAPVPRGPFEVGSGLWGMGGGLVAFDYGAKTHRFGEGLEEAEAGDVTEEIRRRLPSGA